MPEASIMARLTARPSGRPNPTFAGAAGAVESRSRAMRIVVVKDPRDLVEHIAAWQILADEALEANAFYEPSSLLPALNTLRGDSDVSVILVYGLDTERSCEPAKLCGLFPVERRRWSPVPLHMLSMWCHRHCYLGAPLLHRTAAAPTLDAFLDWLAHQPASLFEWPWLPGSGPFHDLLTASTQERGLPFFTSDRYERALFQRNDTGETTGRAESAHPRLQRLRRRLEEVGPLSVTSPASEGEVTAWVDEFLRLEKQGWKGSAGTALACSAEDSDFFRAAVVEAFRHQRLLALTLRCGEHTVALRCSFLAGNGAFAFKTCYDEMLARYSPGSILELETLRDLEHRPELAWMDSCTTHDNDLLNRLWKQRRPIETRLLATAQGPGRWLVSLLPWIRLARRRLARWRSSASRNTGP